ncbi:GtrA family protein [Microbacterium sp. 18062]|uniref:GtrA family protein n=1 Tax=Microbacterium sp. 18062 TaxID=2681410 RepID=UPI001357B0C6|nr:GtrA family protein [Microbacterium sp. 18062]
MRSLITAVVARPEVRYLFFGGLNTAFSYGLYSVFLIVLHALRVPADFAIATTLSWLISNATSFALQRRYVFRSSGRLLREFAKFSSVTFGSFLANLGLGVFAVAALGLDSQAEKLVSQLVITFILVVATYVLHKAYSFRKPQGAEVLGTAGVLNVEAENRTSRGAPQEDNLK